MALRGKNKEDTATGDQLIQRAIKQLKLNHADLEKRLAILQKEVGVYTIRDHAS